MAEAYYSITIAAKKSGLSSHVIRIWEKRYNAVSPNRSHSNRRRYSDAEIERLRLLSAATKAGHRIGDIAKLGDDKLGQLVLESGQIGPSPSRRQKHSADPVEPALEAVQEFDHVALGKILESASVSYGQHGLLQNLIGPLATRIGILWQDGAMTAAHEHFATAIIRDYLLKNSQPFAENNGAPRLIVVTPSGQLHELGAAIVAAAARDLGWAITYLGPNLPAAEIASAAVQYKADAVALSIVYPGDDANLPIELSALRKLLPATTPIIAGGRAAESYATALQEIGATRTTDLKALYGFLDRTQPRGRFQSAT